MASVTGGPARLPRRRDLPVSYGVSWDMCVRIVLIVALALTTALPGARLFAAVGDRISVIVREAIGAGQRT